jgi:hypothetical protein
MQLIALGLGALGLGLLLGMGVGVAASDDEAVVDDLTQQVTVLENQATDAEQVADEIRADADAVKVLEQQAADGSLPGDGVYPQRCGAWARID